LGNIIGERFRVLSFGESHGKIIGVVVDGCPAGVAVNIEDIQRELNRRKPGQSAVSTPRVEEDKVEILSGVFNNKTTGAPICMIIRNLNVDSSKYEEIRYTPRPGHADYPAYIKYGGYNDYRGGGRFSGRITASYVMAGALAKTILKELGIKILAYTRKIGPIEGKKLPVEEIERNVEKSIVRCPDLDASEKMVKIILKAKSAGDSVGGVIECIALNVPTGIGEPVFDTLEGDIAKAVFSVPGVKGIEFGSGFKAAEMKGSQHNDQYAIEDNRVVTKTNNSGGILGGISNGMPIVFRVAVKPTASIGIPQQTVNLITGKEEEIVIKGRHDPCIVPRAVPIIEHVTAIVLVDHCIRAGLIPPVYPTSDGTLQCERDKIKLITQEILKLVKKRMDAVEKVKSIKIKKKLPIVDKEVENQIRLEAEKFSKSIGLDSEIAKDIVELLIKKAIEFQEKKLNLLQFHGK